MFVIINHSPGLRLEFCDVFVMFGDLSTKGSLEMARHLLALSSFSFLSNYYPPPNKGGVGGGGGGG